MAVNPAMVPSLSPFQQQHVGTVLTGLSGVLPFRHKNPPMLPAPVVTTPVHVIGSHFHLFNKGGVLSTTIKNRAYY